MKKKSKNRIKVAVLDSGVDYGNDIAPSYSVILVPGEEDVIYLKFVLNMSGERKN